LENWDYSSISILPTSNITSFKAYKVQSEAQLNGFEERRTQRQVESQSCSSELEGGSEEKGPGFSGKAELYVAGSGVVARDNGSAPCASFFPF
jgi:hypothetical protein